MLLYHMVSCMSTRGCNFYYIVYKMITVKSHAESYVDYINLRRVIYVLLHKRAKIITTGALKPAVFMISVIFEINKEYSRFRL